MSNQVERRRNPLLEGSGGWQILPALWKSAFSLTRHQVWRWLFIPLLVAALVFGLLYWQAYMPWVDWVMRHPPFSWLVAREWLWSSLVLAHLSVWMLIFALTYLAVQLVVALAIQPWLLEAIARMEYPELARMGRDSFLASTGNSLFAALVFAALWLIAMPFWLIPGVGLIVPLLLLAWLNRQTFVYDTLAVFATETEGKRIRETKKRSLFVLGLMLAMLAHVPFLGFLVPVFSVLAYTHFCLAALRRLRGDALVWEANGEGDA
jgi:hypothetical protein